MKNPEIIQHLDDGVVIYLYDGITFSFDPKYNDYAFYFDVNNETTKKYYDRTIDMYSKSDSLVIGLSIERVKDRIDDYNAIEELDKYNI